MVPCFDWASPKSTCRPPFPTVLDWPRSPYSQEPQFPHLYVEMIYEAKSRCPEFGRGEDVVFVSSWGYWEQTFHIVIVATAKARVYAKRTCGTNTSRIHRVENKTQCSPFTRKSASHEVTRGPPRPAAKAGTLARVSAGHRAKSSRRRRAGPSRGLARAHVNGGGVGGALKTAILEQRGRGDPGHRPGRKRKYLGSGRKGGNRGTRYIHSPPQISNNSSPQGDTPAPGTTWGAERYATRMRVGPRSPPLPRAEARRAVT